MALIVVVLLFVLYRVNAMNEIHAHAALAKHPHIVSYFSSWAENDRVFLQTEFCNGGSLADAMYSEVTQRWRRFSELELRQILAHIADGLKYIHSRGLVHLDIKPGMYLLTNGT